METGERCGTKVKADGRTPFSFAEKTDYKRTKMTLVRKP